MPILYAQKLQGLLEEQGSSAEISTTEERREAIREENKKHFFTTHPIFSGGRDFRPEYLCPKCDYKLDEKSICPTHRIPLLEYSEWLAERNKPGEWAWLGKILSSALVAYLAYLYLNFALFDKLPFMP